MFILITLVPIVGPSKPIIDRTIQGLLAGFTDISSDATGPKKKLISIFRENTIHSVNSSAYLITKIHWNINSRTERLVFYRLGDTVEDSEKEAKKAMAAATALFKTFIATCGAELKNGCLTSKAPYTGYQKPRILIQSKEEEASIAKTSSNSSVGNTSQSVDNTSKTEAISTVKPEIQAVDWKKPLWISRKSNQHTIKTTAAVKKKLLRQIAKAATEAAEAVEDKSKTEIEQKKEPEATATGSGKSRGRVIDTKATCYKCESKWSCDLPHTYTKCHLFRLEQSDYSFLGCP